jgi:hypothetical protein
MKAGLVSAFIDDWLGEFYAITRDQNRKVLIYGPITHPTSSRRVRREPSEVGLSKRFAVADNITHEIVAC